MSDKYAEIQQKGVRVVVIGNGSPDQAMAFKIEQKIRFDLWVDPDMKAYAAAGLRRGFMSVVSPKSLGHAVRAMRAGFKQSSVQGDPWQLGGLFLFTKKGETVYSHISKEAGDHPDLEKVMSIMDYLKDNKA